MKKLSLFIIAIIIGYFIYNYFYKKKAVEVKENIVITQASGLDINAGPFTEKVKRHVHKCK